MHNVRRFFNILLANAVLNREKTGSLIRAYVFLFFSQDIKLYPRKCLKLFCETESLCINSSKKRKAKILNRVSINRQSLVLSFLTVGQNATPYLYAIFSSGTVITKAPVKRFCEGQQS